MTKSDFPEFDKSYKSILVKDPTDLFEHFAAQANFNIYHSDIWRGTARRFAEYIVEECAACCGSQADKKNIRKRFGLSVESNVKYPAEDPSGSIESQYRRSYNIPDET
jgi:hypothetical protein